jgi:hypothetical protein
MQPGPRPRLGQVCHAGVERPGRYRVRAPVRDNRTNPAGTAPRFVTVPERQ